MGDFVDSLKSRKFLLTLAVLAFYITAYILGKPLSIDEVKILLSITLPYVGVEGVADVVERYKKSD